MTQYSVGDVALILGVSSGFGAATARRLASSGCGIIGVHLDRAAGARAADELRVELEAHGVPVHFFNTNAADTGKREEVINEILKMRDTSENGLTVRLLLHSLAFGSLRPFISSEDTMITEAQLSMTQNVMASSLIFWTQELWKHNLFASSARVLALTSSGSHRVLPNYGAVSAAKASLESFCRQLSFEMGSSGVTVNAIEAGVTDTPALRKIPGQEAIRAHATERNPKSRLTTPEDIAAAVDLLCDDGAAWINGTTLRVDGGEGIVELDWRKES